MRSVSVALVAVLLVAADGTACRTTGTKAAPPTAQPRAGAAPAVVEPGAEAARPGAEASPPVVEPDEGAAPSLVQPGAPGAPSRAISAEQATDLSGVQHTAADVRFMQGMIGHHAQALAMTALLSTRSRREDMQRLALRITLSQEDEIRMMQGWLRARGEQVPGIHDLDKPGAMLMPGMLTAAEMSRLAAATGAAFDRLFLEGMIKHHEGALTMVDELYAIAGAGQESIISAFAAEVVADQRAEIDRMGAMLNTMRKEQ